MRRLLRVSSLSRARAISLHLLLLLLFFLRASSSSPLFPRPISPRGRISGRPPMSVLRIYKIGYDRGHVSREIIYSPRANTLSPLPLSIVPPGWISGFARPRENGANRREIYRLEETIDDIGDDAIPALGARSAFRTRLSRFNFGRHGRSIAFRASRKIVSGLNLESKSPRRGLIKSKDQTRTICLRCPPAGIAMVRPGRPRGERSLSLGGVDTFSRDLAQHRLILCINIVLYFAQGMLPLYHILLLISSDWMGPGAATRATFAHR